MSAYDDVLERLDAVGEHYSTQEVLKFLRTIGRPGQEPRNWDERSSAKRKILSGLRQSVCLGENNRETGGSREVMSAKAELLLVHALIAIMDLKVAAASHYLDSRNRILAAPSPVTLFRVLEQETQPSRITSGQWDFRFELNRAPDKVWLQCLSVSNQAIQARVVGEKITVTCHPESLQETVNALKMAIEEANERFTDVVSGDSAAHDAARRLKL